MNNENIMKVEYEYVWKDSSIAFYCPGCNAFLIGDSQDGIEECECGLKYQFTSFLLINGIKVTEYIRKEGGNNETK